MIGHKNKQTDSQTDISTLYRHWTRLFLRDKIKEKIEETAFGSNGLSPPDLRQRAG